MIYLFLKVLEMDATKMTFESEYFDVIIDKGTLDALIVKKNLKIVQKINYIKVRKRLCSHR